MFEYKPIQFSETRRVSLPEHPISRHVLRNAVLNKVFSLLERRILGIRKGLEVYESTYQVPIATEYPENNVGRVRKYKASDKSAVIVLPQRGSGYSMAQLIASYLASNGISAYELETPFHGLRLPKGMRSMCELPIDLDKLKAIFNQAVTETRGLIDLVEEEKIGIFGVSLGAIYASVVYGVDDRVSSACLMMGGGNLADMIFDSDDHFARYLRRHLTAYGISRRELRKELEEIEPCNYARPDKADNMLMVNASLDKEVPVKYGEELRRAWGNPEQVLLNATHLGIAMHSLRILQKILSHYKRTLGD